MRTTNPLLRFLGILLILFSSISLPGRHIIGGDITYRCLGGGDFEIQMKIYRDCSTTNGDYFDFNAPLTIFQEVGNSYLPFEHMYVPLLEVTEIPPELDNPCSVIPGNVCVEEGFYRFTISLPDDNSTYHIVYQRCCRNNTISNIYNPGEIGATFSIALTPFARSTCNDSPVFNEFPPIVICQNKPLVFDHSATDPQGDELVYGLCNPLLGAGPEGFLLPGDPAGCNGFRPDPACPPPFDSVSWITPTFSSQTPMGGDPPVSINTNTGIISGTPLLQGQYVMGICVSEYRDGQLLSVVRRDFQFNVTYCTDLVQALIDAEIINQNEFYIKACENPYTLHNLSFDEENIDSQTWQFDFNGTQQSFSDWSPTIDFPGFGTYEGVLILNPDSPCGDSARITVDVFPGSTADFSYTYDTCIAGPVTFADLSTSNSQGGIQEWEWNFDDGTTIQEQAPSHHYQSPGTFYVQLSITDADGCQDEHVQLIDYFPIPPELIIYPNTQTGCIPSTIIFDNLSSPISDTYQILWDFGDGQISNDITPVHTYTELGTFDVSLEVISPIGCSIDTLVEDWITIVPAPQAGFSFTPEQPSNISPEVHFQDESQRAVDVFWDFGTGVTSTFFNPSYVYPDTGLYEVLQIVTHANGCTDSLLQLIDVYPEVRYFLPNAFTPNGDGQNDSYIGVGVVEGIRNFNMSIWNRWGEIVFESTDPITGWNGRKNNIGRYVSAGVYVVLVKYTDARGKQFEIKRFATVIK